MHVNSKAIQQIVNVLKKKRLEIGMNQRELADELGVSYTYLSLLENGKKPRFSTAILVRYADTLGENLAVIIWESITEETIAPEKRECFKALKPHIDRMIESIMK